MLLVMKIVERFNGKREIIVSLFGFAMVFIFGFFSGYYYLLEQVNKSEIKIIEPGADCADLFEGSLIPSKQNSAEIGVKQDNTLAKETEAVKRYVASKNSKVFHKPDCSFAAKIKEENKVWFSSIEEAESKGFKPHSCVNQP